MTRILRTALALCLGAAIASCAPVKSQTVMVNDILTWTNPNTNTDGTPLTNLASIRAQWGSTPGGPYNLGAATVADTYANPVTTMTLTRTGTGVGTLCYVVIAVAATGTESAPSNESCKTVAPAPSTPNAATNLTVK